MAAAGAREVAAVKHVITTPAMALMTDFIRMAAPLVHCEQYSQGKAGDL